MKKIGLYLGLDPGLGAFQYSLSMLEAVASLPRGAFSPIVFFSSRAWSPYLEGLNLEVRHLPKSLPARIINRLFLSLRMPVEPWRWVARYVDPFSKAFVDERCDVWIFPAQDPWAYLIPVPSLASVHDLMHRYEGRFPEVSEHGMYQSREYHYQKICQWSLGALVDSLTGKEQVEASYGIAAENVHVLPYTPPKYIYSMDTPEDFDERYSLPDKYFFYPAQFWEHKNHRALIRAVDALKGEFPDMKLVFAGSKKNAYESCVELVDALHLQDRVVFLGYVPDKDMPELYRRARALVMPTFFGPTNIPPLEAFVAGCPVAVSKIYGMPEQVSDAALLFDPESDQDIANLMRRLWTDDQLCADLIEKGKLRSGAFSSEMFNERLAAILEKVLSDINA